MLVFFSKLTGKPCNDLRWNSWTMLTVDSECSSNSTTRWADPRIWVFVGCMNNFLKLTLKWFIGYFMKTSPFVFSSSQIKKKFTLHIPCVIVPSFPRYLFFHCCLVPGDWTNAGEANFSQNVLNGFIRLKNLLIQHLVSEDVTNFRVLNSRWMTNCITTANINVQVNTLGQCMTKTVYNL